MPAFSHSIHHSQKWPDRASNASNSSDLQTLRDENKQLRELVIQLSNIVIKNIVDAKWAACVAQTPVLPGAVKPVTVGAHDRAHSRRSSHD